MVTGTLRPGALLRSMLYPQRLEWALPQRGCPVMSAEHMNAWDSRENKVWWQGGSGRGFAKQPGSRGEQVGQRARILDREQEP